jgi:hypothetical protein
MTVNMESHVMPAGKMLISKSAAEVLIVSPPRSGLEFAQKNLRSILEDALEAKVLGTQYLSELDVDKKIISIVRKPSDWITSWAADILEHEPGRNLEAVVAREVAAAEVALQAYLNFESDNIIFVKFEDLVFKFAKLATAIAPSLGKSIASDYDRIILSPEKSLLHNPTSTSLDHYPAVVEELAKHDLSAINALYTQLLARTVTIV